MALTPTEIRAFLREKQALLVHFSTLMAKDTSRCFPDDLQNAWELVNTPLSHSTIQRGDTPPAMIGGGKGGAEGSIGMVVDVGANTAVLAVGPGDIGSSYDSDIGKWNAGGSPPTRDACEDSISNRAPSNEWYVRDFIPIGVIVLPPLQARELVDLGPGGLSHADVSIELSEVLEAFPDKRIFGADGTSFKVYDRTSGKWADIGYDEIISPDNAP